MTDFAKGVNIKVVQTQYGEIIKIGINTKEFANNPVNDDGWVNFDILTSKNGKKYTALDTFKAKQKQIDVGDDEYPF